MAEREWPGAERREPPLRSPTYAVRAPLAAWLREEAAAARERFGRYRVLDVGCGVKPYLPFFAPHAETYVGVDPGENPLADLRGTVEALPVEDAAFELVLCNQVLEHCDSPAQAVRELRRVTAPGGCVLASTHGVQVYHPAPDDLWRWTHAGLERLFREHADWASLSVRPGAGTASCVAMLLAVYLDLAGKRAGVRRAAGAGVSLLNRLGRALDARFPALREPAPGTLFANYHVRAEVASAGRAGAAAGRGRARAGEPVVPPRAPSFSAPRGSAPAAASRASESPSGPGGVAQGRTPCELVAAHRRDPLAAGAAAGRGRA
jgi:SAM-dependent methyltransferase